MQYVATNLSNTAEFETRPAPWVIRSKEVKGRKVVPVETAEELKKLKALVQDQILALSAKDRQLEEHSIKIEHLESRTKDSRQYTAAIHKLEAEIETLRRAKTRADADLEKMKDDHRVLAAQHENGRAELNALRKARVAGDQLPPLGNVAARDETTVLQLTAEVEYLRQELSSLQSVIRYMKRENRYLKTPLNSTSPLYAWLDPSTLHGPRVSDEASFAAAESKDVFGRLLDLAASIKPIALQERDAKKNTSWRAVKSTSRYQVLEQREELEKWSEWKGDLVRRVRAAEKVRAKKSSVSKSLNLKESKKSNGLDEPRTPSGESHGITIVGSPP
jgi:dynactin 1